jgi:squalene-hopene/tetraprenyl-beta-curcumene cyclase
MILALDAWRRSSSALRDSAADARDHAVFGLSWLTRLQNRNGGWPTFCRGWGKLPFDRSGTDLTAHVLRAFKSCYELAYDSIRVNPRPNPHKLFFRRDARRAMSAGQVFLLRSQHPDGSWSPLWFGNQDHPQEDNPVYGTAKVLFAYRDLGLMDSPEAQRGVAWLVANQNADGGWGSGVWGKRVRSAELGARSGVLSTEYSVLGTESSIPSPQPLAPSSLTSSIEETALAVEALLAARGPTPDPRLPTPAQAAEKGLTWLIERVERGEHRHPAPIGFYFAKLWYYERLYPLIFTVAALGRACRELQSPHLSSCEHPASTGTTPWTTAAP